MEEQEESDDDELALANDPIAEATFQQALL